MTSFCCLYCYLWTYFAPWSSVSIVNFEQVKADWDSSRYRIFVIHSEMHKKKDIQTFSTRDLFSGYFIVDKSVYKHDKNRLKIFLVSFVSSTLWTKSVYWTYTRISENVQDVLNILNTFNLLTVSKGYVLQQNKKRSNRNMGCSLRSSIPPPRSLSHTNGDNLFSTFTNFPKD